MKETILLFNITDRNTKLKLERILFPLKAPDPADPGVSVWTDTGCAVWSGRTC